MNSQASRVAVVNQIARQLIHNGHPGEKDIKAQQDQLNNRSVPLLTYMLYMSLLPWPTQGITHMLYRCPIWTGFSIAYSSMGFSTSNLSCRTSNMDFSTRNMSCSTVICP